MIRLAALAACLALSGCTLSPVPITAAGGKQTDKRLLGLWQYTIQEADKLKTELVSIELNDKGEFISHTLLKDGQPVEKGDMRMVVARLGDERYVSVTSREVGEALYVFARYEFLDADHFVLFAPDIDQLKAAMDSKLIAGKWLEDQRHGSNIQLEASETELRAFVMAHGKRIFSVRTFELERVDAEATPGAARPTTPSRR